MIAHQPPPNWVAERAKCNLDLKFEALCQVVRRDVDEMNKLPCKIRRGYKFVIDENGEGTEPLFQVFRYPEEENGPVRATFERSINSIRINSIQESGYTDLLVRPTWNKQALTCKLNIGGKSFETWEVSQKALGFIFFG